MVNVADTITLELTVEEADAIYAALARSDWKMEVRKRPKAEQIAYNTACAKLLTAQAQHGLDELNKE